MDYTDFFSVLSNQKRLQILGLLNNEELKTSQISKKLDSSIQVLTPHINLLSENKIIAKNSADFFYISSLGKTLLEQIKFFEFCAKNNSFFKTHDFGDIPYHLMSRLGSLAEFEYVDGITPCFTRWKKVIDNASEFLYCIFTQPPILIADNILKKIESGTKFRLVFGENSIIEECSEFIEKMYLKTNHSPFEFEKRMVKKVSINMLVSENDACLMFPYKNGTTDMHRSFVSSDKEFCQWCLDFFNHKWKDGKTFSKLRVNASKQTSDHQL